MNEGMKWNIFFVIIAIAVGFAAGVFSRQGTLGAPVQQAADTLARVIAPAPGGVSVVEKKEDKPTRTLTLIKVKKGEKTATTSEQSLSEAGDGTRSLGTEAVKMDTLETKQEQMKGYTNRKRPPDNHGFLYVLDKPSRYAYWMKNMLFSTDVVWLSADFRVVDLKAAIAPETYPDQIFEPVQPASYMLEFADGFIPRHGIEIGDVIDVDAFLGK